MHQAPPAPANGRADAIDSRVRTTGERIAVALEGVCSINGRSDISCATLGISLGGASIAAVADIRVGDKVKLSFRQTGILSGSIIDRLPSGFSVAFDPQPGPRFVRFVEWLHNRRAASAVSFADRQHERIVPLKKLARLKRESGAELFVRTIDVSRSGIAFDRSADIAVGEKVMVGKHPGIVVRLWETGAAVAFDQALSAEGFDVTISFT